ncbi:hypothetical protein I3843_10G140800 [Carya illinoinensis]|uniref:Uncharacterized protein n=1 Tax=Carya illinoinensis TaxID=32201 RepID=A0A922DYF4_CARIL|nr:hypothetical protein I3842_10G146400 [Carya illinoinensis]KAG7960759.1 hypothetical protein I3843_10G140800 [Carya illinoinensis]
MYHLRTPPKHLLLVLLLILIVSTSQLQLPGGVAEARPISSIPQQRYSKIFSTLGIVCKCCDGDKGECTSTRTESCSNLQCFPWKLN